MSPCATTFLAQRSDQVTAGLHVWGCRVQVESPWKSSFILNLTVLVRNVLLDGKWQMNINESTVSDTNDTNSVWQLIMDAVCLTSPPPGMKPWCSHDVPHNGERICFQRVYHIHLAFMSLTSCEQNILKLLKIAMPKAWWLINGSRWMIILKGECGLHKYLSQ